MSKNISNLSGRIGLKDNLFKKMSENILSESPKDISEIAKEYNLGVSTIHGWLFLNLWCHLCAQELFLLHDKLQGQFHPLAI